MRLIYDLSQKVEESDAEAMSKRMTALDEALAAARKAMVAESDVDDAIKAKLEGVWKELGDKAGLEETRRAMDLVTGLSERVEMLSGLGERMDKVSGATEQMQGDYDQRLLSVEGQVMDKADKNSLEDVEAKLREMARLGDDEDEGGEVRTGGVGQKGKGKKDGITRREFERKLASMQKSITEAMEASAADSSGLEALMPGSSAFRCLACDAPLIKQGSAADMYDVQSTVQVPGAVSQLYNISNRAPTAASFMDGSDVTAAAARPETASPPPPHHDAPSAVENSGYVPPVWTS